jgi:hypothetical protein
MWVWSLRRKPKIKTTKNSFKAVAGAHIDNEEEERKGRSAKRPRERLKFQNFPTVVTLLNLEQWHNAHGANWREQKI